MKEQKNRPNRPELSVAICTYNPRQDLLRWTLDSIAAQTLPRSEWELLIVDNKSSPPLDESALRAEHRLPIRVISESRQGIAWARYRAIQEARCELLLFVDDDNFLNPDYFETALEIAQSEPAIGAFGGRSRGVLERPIEPWKRPLLPYLAVGDRGLEPIVSYAIPWGPWEPVGAGMVLRRRAVSPFLAIMEAGMGFGRVGDQLLNGEDGLIAKAVNMCGFANSYQPRLQFLHFMKASRLRCDYLRRLMVGYGRSHWQRNKTLGTPNYPVPYCEAGTYLANAYQQLIQAKGRVGAILWYERLGYVAESLNLSSTAAFEAMRRNHVARFRPRSVPTAATRACGVSAPQDGWEGSVGLKLEPSRHYYGADPRSTIQVHGDGAGQATLHLTCVPLNPGQTLCLLLNGIEVFRHCFSAHGERLRIPLALSLGRNTVDFVGLAGGFRFEEIRVERTPRVCVDFETAIERGAAALPPPATSGKAIDLFAGWTKIETGENVVFGTDGNAKTLACRTPRTCFSTDEQGVRLFSFSARAQGQPVALALLLNGIPVPGGSFLLSNSQWLRAVLPMVLEDGGNRIEFVTRRPDSVNMPADGILLKESRLVEDDAPTLLGNMKDLRAAGLLLAACAEPMRRFGGWGAFTGLDTVTASGLSSNELFWGRADGTHLTVTTDHAEDQFLVFEARWMAQAENQQMRVSLNGENIAEHAWRGNVNFERVVLPIRLPAGTNRIEFSHEPHPSAQTHVVLFRELRLVRDIEAEMRQLSFDQAPHRAVHDRLFERKVPLLPDAPAAVAPLRISLVVPNFNTGATLERAILSLLQQDYPNLQLIMADGGSSDQSLEVIERYRKHFDVLICGPDAGQADGLNKGFRQANGDVFGWLCADDELLPGALHHVDTLFRQNLNVDVVNGGCERIYADGLRCLTAADEAAFELIAFQDRIEQPSTFWRASLHRKVGELDTTFHLAFDWDLWARFAREGARLKTTPMVLSRYFFSADNKTASAGARHATEALRVIKRYGSENSLAAACYQILFRFDLLGCLDQPTTASAELLRTYDWVRRLLSAVVGSRCLELYNLHFASLQQRGLVWWR